MKSSDRRLVFVLANVFVAGLLLCNFVALLVPNASAAELVFRLLGALGFLTIPARFLLQRRRESADASSRPAGHSAALRE